MTEIQPQKKNRWYQAARAIAWIAEHTIAPTTYHNVERMPQQGPCIIISNHQHWMDPVFIAHPVKGSDIVFMGKKELASNKITKKIFTKLRMIIVDRHHSDMEAMRACSRALRNGEILGIFPEGTRHHKGVMEEVESGVGVIALRANVPLVPVYLTPYQFGKRTHCYVGQPIDYADLREEGVNAETSRKLIERITATYAEMVKNAVR